MEVVHLAGEAAVEPVAEAREAVGLGRRGDAGEREAELAALRPSDVSSSVGVSVHTTGMMSTVAANGHADSMRAAQTQSHPHLRPEVLLLGADEVRVRTRRRSGRG